MIQPYGHKDALQIILTKAHHWLFAPTHPSARFPDFLAKKNNTGFLGKVNHTPPLGDLPPDSFIHSQRCQGVKITALDLMLDCIL